MNAIVRKQTLPVPTYINVELGRQEQRVRLGDIIAASEQLDATLAPVDYDRALATTTLAFDPAKGAGFALITRDGIGDRMPLSRTALYQIASHAGMPGHMMSNLLRTVDLGGDAAAKAATLVAALWLRASPSIAKIRTVQDGGRRIVRGVVSQTYAEVSNTEILRSIAAAYGPDAEDYTVVSARLTGDLMRIRFLADNREIGTPNEHRIVRADSGEKPIAAVEAWNSEVGTRAVHLRAIGYRMICANGLQSFTESAKFRWNHSGNADRIRAAIASAAEGLALEAHGVLAAYDRALGIAIDHEVDWLLAEITGDTTGAEREAIVAALDDATTTRHDDGSPRLLASTIDAITLGAHRLYDVEDGDLLAVERLEALAGRVLRRGLAQAEHDGRILAPIGG